MKKKGSPKQLELFDLSGIAQAENGYGKRHYWYYITSPRNEKMVYGLSPDGAPLWCDHDTRPGVGVTPYLFNNAYSARRLIKDRKLSACVKRWDYSYK
jgi:hypothetical protein